MWEKRNWILLNEYFDLSLVKKKVFYPFVGVLLLTVLQSDALPKPSKKQQEIPTIESIQHRYHDWFILPSLSQSHEE